MNHVINKKSILILSALIIILLLLFFATSTQNETHVIKSLKYEELIYGGEIVDKTFNGKTIIKDKTNNFNLSGFFESGVFKEGSIYIKENNIEYFLEGTFDNFYLQKGKIIINTTDKIIEKNGNFLDNKLNGVGSLKIKNKANNDIIFYYAGKFEDDTPIKK